MKKVNINFDKNSPLQNENLRGDFETLAKEKEIMLNTESKSSERVVKKH